MKYAFLLFLLAGCIELTELEKEERDFQRDYEWAETYDKWVTCKALYSRAGHIWYGQMVYGRHIRRKPSTTDMKREIRANGCRLRYE